MAFQSKDLSVLAYANGFTLWHYTTADKTEEVSAPDYFNDGSDMLRAGDMIFANLDTDGVSEQGGILFVNDNTAGVIKVQDMTAQPERLNPDITSDAVLS